MHPFLKTVQQLKSIYLDIELLDDLRKYHNMIQKYPIL